MPTEEIETDMLPATRPAAQVGFGVHALPPQQLVEKATEMASVLTNVIRDQKLFKSIQGRNFVVCEGWTTAGAMLGFVPGIEWTKQDPDRPGVYISQAVLTDMRTGVVIARANAECGDPDEKDRNGEPMWSSRAAYARRSMSETRAVSKVCRIALSWVVKMAGFDPTPAEEVPEGGFEKEPEIPASVQPTDPPPETQREGVSGYVFKFGKHKGQRLEDVPTGYIRWLITDYMPPKVDNKQNKYRDKDAKDLALFVAEAKRRDEAGDGDISDDDIPF